MISGEECWDSEEFINKFVEFPSSLDASVKVKREEDVRLDAEGGVRDREERMDKDVIYQVEHKDYSSFKIISLAQGLSEVD